MTPTPSQIFASFERGEMDRDEMHGLMAIHAGELIQEMEEDYQNPAAAWIEGLRARRATSRLVRSHGARVLREILGALAEVPDFPSAGQLWNASHPDVPLHCFFRIRREPVFRVLSVDPVPGGIRVIVEHGAAAKGKAMRRTFLLKRDNQWKLRAEAVG